MGQNVIFHLVKMYYQKSLLVHVLSLEEDDISRAFKKITLKDAMFFLVNSWNKLSPDIIIKCWKNIFCYSVDNDPSDATINLEIGEGSDNIHFN